MNYREISSCRVCKNSSLKEVLSLGDQFLTGVFPKSPEEQITKGPMNLVWCDKCGLLQLGHSYSLEEMYGENYGYRSGLNDSMVKHLQKKSNFLQSKVTLNEGDIVVDIGSNDSTFLKTYNQKGVRRVGIDPTGKKFKKYYPKDVTLIPDFFSGQKYRDTMDAKAKIVTSIAMFYDLEDPIDFAKQVYDILRDDGIWHFEQSYMPSMLRMNSYDTICQEHIEYYSLNTVKYILDAANFRIIDVRMNAVNGGSFAVTVAKKTNKDIEGDQSIVKWLLHQENRLELMTLNPYQEFQKRVFRHKEDLSHLLNILDEDGKKVYGYGASTKGNVLLQFCNIDSNHIKAVAEVNEEKFGAYTPGTNIPITSEADVKAQNPDYMIVLPWHFKDNILQREENYIKNGGKIIFPLPEIEII